LTGKVERGPAAPAERGEVAEVAEVSLAKLLLFPATLAALQAPGPDLSFPVSVELSLTSQCHQNCLWCSDRALRAKSPDRLDLALLDRLFEELARGGTQGVSLEGGGEPTLSPLFPAAARAARARGLAVGLITNGLDLFRQGLTLADYEDFEWIRVSLDAAGPETYRALKGRDGFEEVLANLARLAALKPALTLGAGYVLTNRNDRPEDLAGLAETLRNLGLDYLHIRPVVDHPDLASRRDLGFLDSFVNLAALADNAASGNGNLPCRAHSLSSVIGADGLVWLCGRLNIALQTRPLGDLTRTGFAEIWAGEERRRQAGLAASADFCRAHCPPCRLTKYNRLLHRLAGLKTRNFI
jgi:MoaA/NifB/PqqE/SkfB family radical SAM enzyme